MDSAVRTGTRLRALLVRLVVTAGLMAAAWLISSLLAGSASASTSSGQAETDAAPSSSQQGLLSGLLGGLTQTVTTVLGTGDEANTPPPSDSDTSAEDPATLPEVVIGSSSSTSTGTASTTPAEPVEQVNEPPAVKRESHTVAQAVAKPVHKTQVRHAAPKRATAPAASKPNAKPATVDTAADTANRAKAPVPTPPPAPQAPAAPATALSAGHDGTAHGKNWLLTIPGDALLTPPTATGTAIDHRTTAVVRDRDRPATAPD